MDRPDTLKNGNWEARLLMVEKLGQSSKNGEPFSGRILHEWTVKKS